MFQLALETSHRQASVALLEDAKLLSEQALAGDTARSLVPALHDLLAAANLTPEQVGLISTTYGPGSFTGLRLGITTAKMLAYALQADLIALNTLELLAHQAALAGAVSAEQLIAPMVDAQRGDVVAAVYRGAENSSAEATSASQLCTLSPRLVEASSFLSSLAHGTLLTGAGLTRHQDRVPTELPLAPKSCWLPQASVLGQMAWRLHQAERRDDLWQLVPQYYRRSAAEEKAEREDQARQTPGA